MGSGAQELPTVSWGGQRPVPGRGDHGSVGRKKPSCFLFSIFKKNTSTYSFMSPRECELSLPVHSPNARGSRAGESILVFHRSSRNLGPEPGPALPPGCRPAGSGQWALTQPSTSAGPLGSVSAPWEQVAVSRGGADTDGLFHRGQASGEQAAPTIPGPRPVPPPWACSVAPVCGQSEAGEELGQCCPQQGGSRRGACWGPGAWDESVSVLPSSHLSPAKQGPTVE